MSIQHAHFSLREARTVSELESLFRLRYQGYLQSSCAALVHQSGHGLELDSYDWHAYHLGLFQEGQYGGQPIGYMRLVQETPSRMAPLASRLAAKFPALLPPPPRADAPLPMMASCPQKEYMLELYHSRRARGQKIMEGSRFVFSPEVRAAGYARFVFEGALASIFYRYGYDYAMLACHPRHAPFYVRYGFRQLLDGSDNDYQGLSASILGISFDEIALGRAARIETAGKQMKAKGALFLLADNAPAPAAQASV